MKNTILLATLLLSSSCALAGNVYVGINAGSSTQRLGVGDASISDDTYAGKAYGGYQINSNIGVEGGYIRFGEGTASAEGFTIGAKPTSIYAALTGAMPASPQLDVFVKLGVVRSDTTVFASDLGGREETDESRTSVLLGTGVQYKFSNTVSLVGEYEYFGKVAKDRASAAHLKASLVSIGFRIAF